MSTQLELCPVKLTELWKRNEDGNIIIISDADFQLKTCVLNKLGSLIWEQIDGNKNVSQLVSEIKCQINNDGITEEILTKDIIKFLNSLHEKWFIRWKEN
jgi:hypothetical protein